MINKIPPINLDIERAILGAILIDPKCLGEITSYVAPEDFYKQSHGLIYKAMQNMIRENKGIDIITLTTELGDKLQEAGGSTYIAQLMSSAMPLNIESYAKILKEYSSKRELIKISYGLLEESYKADNASIDIINKVQLSMMKLAEYDMKESVNCEESVRMAFTEMEKHYKAGGEITGISTGIKTIDKRIDGLRPGDFDVIAARSSMGKTAVALNIASNVSKTEPVLYFTMEMPVVQLMNRIISCQSGIPLENISRGKLDSSMWAKVMSVSGKIGKQKLTINFSRVTVEEIRHKCKKIKMADGLKVCVVDYIGLIKTTGRSESRQVDVSRISNELKAIAMDLNITMIGICQLNRNPEMRGDHKPQLGDLRESGSIEQDADTVLLLYRDEYYNKDSADKNKLEVICAKNRNGEVGTDKIFWSGKTQMVGDIYNGY